MSERRRTGAVFTLLQWSEAYAAIGSAIAAHSDRLAELIIPETLALSSRRDTPGKHAMVLLNQWQGRTGRVPYLAALVISSAAIDNDL
jgi:hypothetical protein